MMLTLFKKFTALTLGFCFVVAGVVCVSAWIEHTAEERQISALLSAEQSLPQLDEPACPSLKTSKVIPREKHPAPLKGCAPATKSNFLLSSDRAINHSLLLATPLCPWGETRYLFRLCRPTKGADLT